MTGETRTPQGGITIAPAALWRGAVLYLSLPLLLFLLFWVRPAVSVPVAAVWLWGHVRASRREQFRLAPLALDRTTLVLCAGVLLVWCFLSGIGGMWYQSTDFDCRNATYYDLLLRDWPVVYPNGSFLCYYFGFWLPPALASKAFLLLGCAPETACFLADKVLFLWAFAGLCLAMLLAGALLSVTTRRQAVGFVLFFVFFSGLDVLPILLFGYVSDPALSSPRLEGWNGFYHVSAMTTTLFWVFNQGIPAWIGTFLLHARRDGRFDAALLVLVAFLAPLTAFGLAFLWLVKAAAGCRRQAAGWVHGCLSAANAASLLPFACFLLFFLSSQRAQGGGAAVPVLHFLWAADPDGAVFPYLLTDFVSGGFEYFPYLLLLFPLAWERPLVCALAFGLPFCSLIQLGASGDFGFRSTIPLMVTLVLLLARGVLAGRIRGGRRLALAVLFAIGCATPLVEIGRGFLALAGARGVVATPGVIDFSTLAPAQNPNYLAPDAAHARFFQWIGWTLPDG